MKSRRRLNRIYSAQKTRLFTRFMLLKSRCFQVTAFSFNLSSIPGPLGQIGWKDINFIGEYRVSRADVIPCPAFSGTAERVHSEQLSAPNTPEVQRKCLIGTPFLECEDRSVLTYMSSKTRSHEVAYPSGKAKMERSGGEGKRRP